MSTQGSKRLKIVNDQPSVEKLWNGRFRLEFFCFNEGKKKDWYGDNIDRILPAFGIKMGDKFGEGEWSLPDGAEYADMTLVEAGLQFIPAAGTHYVKMVYETLTAAFVAEKDEDIDFELNGLQRVTRTFVALPDAPYTKVVGTDTIVIDGTTLFLGSAKIEKTDAKWELTETWLEAGELSREENFEDGKGSITITQIGGCPSAPAGFTAVNESKNNTLGFETCTITFYEDDAVLSRSNDFVGTQLAEVVEVFNPSVEPTPTQGGILGNQSVSNVDGIPTTRYTFLVAGTLSESEDKVGSQLAIVIESFNETPSTPSGYSLARTDISDFDGIPTHRYTFLKPSVLSQSTDNVGSQKAIVIEAFNETPSTPDGYVLAKADASDVEGIPTNRYIFLKPSILSQTEDLVGSQLAIIKEAFGETPSTPAGYTLAKTDTSDVEGIPTKQYTFLRPSILSRSFNDLSDGVQEVTVTTFGGEAHGLAGPVIKETTQDEGGIETVSTTVLQDGNGSSIGGSQISFGMLYPFTYPGVVSLSTRQVSGTTRGRSYTAYDFKLEPPVQANVPATTRITFTTNPEISPVGEIWSPTSWAQGSVVGIGWGYRAFASNKAFRGYRSDPPSGSSIEGTAGEEAEDKEDEVEWPMVTGNRIYRGTSFEVAVSGGPDDPSGNEYTLSYKTSQAFTDINSVQYYRHELVYATV